ncbi:PREDICTED: disintegrin and metalloproteinase domain-containing protein 5-like [Miniopterus natalensis]|uniref:disintegrin and metalloproteinase domain-containing protein 5-like n=1 Tax=Miniopterus natalensis TaxID=291302 RepID=UPI0007A6F66B|nr:PREDICTED: disintegrin and metalloproteinase domain-containing protein 5-like [Miniopterus natalensis]
MGLSFDSIDACFCSGDVCTMSPKALYSPGVKDFSTCSLDEFKYLASSSDLECLHNSQPVTPVYKQTAKAKCGNGVLEPGEQCDCGTVKVSRNFFKTFLFSIYCIIGGKEDKDLTI